MSRLARVVAAVLSLAATGFCGELRVGRGLVDITPPPKMAMGGNFYYQPSTGVHDPLFCKALVIEKDVVKAGIVGCDVESLHQPTVVAARRLISEKTGLKGENVMLTATHTHSGPEMTAMVLEGLPEEPARVARDYHQALPVKIAEAVGRAEADLRPAKLSAGLGHEDSISFNRRRLLADGSVHMFFEQMSPKMVRAMGPIDPTVSVVYFESPDGTPLATHVNFALHTTAFGGSEFSADYPGVMSRLLAQVKGPEMMTLFTNGCAGNINQVDLESKWKSSGAGESARIGTILAAEVMKTYKKLEPLKDEPLKLSKTVLKPPVAEYSTEEVAWARKIIEASRKADGPPFLDVVHANRILNIMEYQDQEPVEIEVQVIALGDKLAWVGLPAEVFVELGMAIKLASPFKYTIVSELANGMLDYIPDRKAYDEGGYEPMTSRCKAGCGELMVDAARKLLIEAYRGQPGALKPYPREDGDSGR